MYFVNYPTLLYQNKFVIKWEQFSHNTCMTFINIPVHSGSDTAVPSYIENLCPLTFVWHVCLPFTNISNSCL